MPQFDVSTYIAQIFWLITTFLCFWFIMDKVIIPKITSTMDERKRKYDELIIKAEKINKKAKASLQKYEKKSNGENIKEEKFRLLMRK